MAPEVSRSGGGGGGCGGGDGGGGRGGVNGGGGHDARADVWSFGITLLELIGVALPADTIVGDSPTHALRPALPPGVVSAWPALGALLDRALDPDAAARPTAEELLQHAAFTEPLVGTGDHYWSRAISVEDLFSDKALPPVATAAIADMVPSEPVSACAWGADTFYDADDTSAGLLGDGDEGLAEEFRAGTWRFET